MQLEENNHKEETTEKQPFIVPHRRHRTRKYFFGCVTVLTVVGAILIIIGVQLIPDVAPITYNDFHEIFLREVDPISLSGLMQNFSLSVNAFPFIPRILLFKKSKKI